MNEFKIGQEVIVLNPNWNDPYYSFHTVKAVNNRFVTLDDGCQYAVRSGRRWGYAKAWQSPSIDEIISREKAEKINSELQERLRKFRLAKLIETGIHRRLSEISVETLEQVVALLGLEQKED